MARPMAFYKQNNLNTTTMVRVDAINTLTIANAFDRDRETRWETVGYGTNTSTIFSIEFPTNTTIISKIFLQNHNLRQYRIFYNSVTANTFTPAISETTNSATSSYYTFNSITVSTIQVQVDRATTVDTEKRIGEIYIGDLMLELERNPNAASYKPILNRQKVIHRMPNGGVSLFIVDEKFKAEVSWKHVTESFTSQLLNVYTTNTTFVFVPFATTSAWDGNAYEMAWTNDYDFKHSDNNKSAGFGGKIMMEEVA